MTEMDQLARLGAEVPACVSPEAERRFHAALSAERARPSARPWRGRLSLPRLAGTAGIAVGLAAVVTAGLVLAVPHSPAKPTVTGLPTVQELAYHASATALAQPAVSPGQWLYVKTTLVGWSGDHRVYSETSEDWQTADDLTQARYSGGKLESFHGTIESVHFSYADLAKFPASPQALAKYIFDRLTSQYKIPVGSGGSTDVAWAETFGAMADLFRFYDLPPQVAAEVFRAMPYIPGVTVEKVPGGGVAFAISTRALGIEEVILDPSSYAVTAVVETHPAGIVMPKGMSGTDYAYLTRVPVSGPGVRP